MWRAAHCARGFGSTRRCDPWPSWPGRDTVQCETLRKLAPRTLAPYTGQSQRTNFNLQPPWLGKLISCQLPSSACGQAQAGLRARKQLESTIAGQGMFAARQVMTSFPPTGPAHVSWLGSGSGSGSALLCCGRWSLIEAVRLSAWPRSVPRRAIWPPLEEIARPPGFR